MRWVWLLVVGCAAEPEKSGGSDGADDATEPPAVTEPGYDDPLTPFEPTLNVVVDGVVHAHGAELDLGRAVVGYEPVVTTLLLVNPTDAPIALSASPSEWITGDVAIGWEVEPPASVDAGASEAAAVVLHPVAGGAVHAELVLPADTGEVAIDLVGTVDPALRWVIVGRLGRTLISHDYGWTWPYDHQEITDPGVSQWWNDINLEEVVYAQGRFVAVGGASVGRYAVSEDGEVWTDTHTGGGIVSALAYGMGTFLAESSGDLMWSDDGETWVEESGSWQSGLSSLAFGGDRFVGVGGGRRVVSLDARSWASDVADGNGLGRIVYGDGVFVAVGEGGLISTTVDGLDWTDQWVGTANRSGVVFADGEFVTGGWPDPMMFSSDGYDWTPIDGSEQVAPMGYFNGTFIASAWVDRLLASPDALSWVEVRGNSDPERAGYTSMAFQQ